MGTSFEKQAVKEVLLVPVMVQSASAIFEGLGDVGTTFLCVRLNEVMSKNVQDLFQELRIIGA